MEEADSSQGRRVPGGGGGAQPRVGEVGSGQFATVVDKLTPFSNLFSPTVCRDISQQSHVPAAMPSLPRCTS